MDATGPVPSATSAPRRMIALDLDGTLVDQSNAAHRWATDMVTSNGFTVDPRVIADALSERKPKGQVFEELVRAFQLPLNADELWADYRAQMPKLVTCSSADKAALTALGRAGWAIGIITNGTVENQEGKIRETGLDRLVDAWVISEQVGRRKPDVALFQTLAERLGCALEGWMVGDSIAHDIEPAAALGLRTAWISTESDTAAPSDSPQPSITVGTVAEAADFILSSRND